LSAEESDHSSYLEYADYLRTRHGESARSFDKTLATLSSGALAISVTFVNVIAPAPTQTLILGLAWGGFALALLTNLLSFFLAERDYFHSMKLLGSDYDEGRFPDDLTPTVYEKWVPIANIGALSLFISGLGLLLWFALVNLGGAE